LIFNIVYTFPWKRAGGIIEKMRLFVAFVTIMALMAVALMPLDMALGQEANTGRVLPDTVQRGEVFDVTVTFTAPADNFNAIGLTDNAPDGWNVQVDETWCTPNADFVKATGNKAEIMWFGPYAKGTNFSVMYKVTVADYACAGNHTFDGSLEYYLEEEPYLENITGDSEVEVPVCTTPLICCSPKSLSFSATPGGSNPANGTLEIWNSGIDTISWTLSDDAAWLSENFTSGSSTGEHDTAAVSVDIAGMSAGNYSASITITAAGAINSPWTVPVSLHISSAPEISFSPERLRFTAGEGGSNPANRTLDIWNSGGGTLNWSVSDNAAWLSENPTTGSSTSEHDTVAVSVDIAGMSAGDYSANITITAPGASNNPQIVLVSLHISSPAPEISFSPESLTFTAGEGGSTPANGTLEIWNSGIGTLTWSLSGDAAWLSENPTSGSSTGEHDTVAVSVDIAGMSAGDYSANITITAPGASNSPQVVPVSLHISSAAPEISCKPESLTFTAGEGGSTVANGTLEVWNSGIEILNWSVSDDAEWLSENPTSGSSTGADDKTLVTVSVNTAGMSAGDYSANITITAPGASNTPQTVSVSLHMGGAGPPPSPIQAWLSQYWWTIVGGIVVVALLVYLLRRRRGV
jgi:predicted secreted protein